ncbi:MAG: alpha-L-arabinofuranosidase C-terminal domain-containing protein [bacterium]
MSLWSVFRSLTCVALAAYPVVAQQAAPATGTTRLVLDAGAGRDTISRHIYGQFAEHLGRLIYDGTWSRTSASAPWHMRADVVQALKKIQVPNIRWPGGCFADTYHWRDGVGPAAQRPSIVNTNWGGVTEDNGVGTHEILALARELGAEPYIVGNIGSGTVQEMHDWWEYVNHPGVSPMADLRRKNGQEAPFNVRFWGMGNEAWGCGGNMRPEYYADELKRYATYLPGYGGVRPYRIAVGPADGDYNWTEVVMREAGGMIDGLDLHHYTIAGTWATKGHATGFSEGQWFSAMRGAVAIDEMIRRHAAIMDKYDQRKRVALIVGEWGMWHDQEPGSHPGFLYQQNTMRDALVAAASLDIFNKHADRVRGANIAQMVNVLQAMILTDGNRMLLTPTYHVFEMYTVHHDAVMLPIAVSSQGWYTLGADSVRAVSASASRDKNGVMHVTMSNLDPTHPRSVAVDLKTTRVTSAVGRILVGDTMDAFNTFEAPERVTPAPFTGARVADGQLTVTLPAHSVVVLELK